MSERGAEGGEKGRKERFMQEELKREMGVRDTRRARFGKREREIQEEIQRDKKHERY